MASNVIQHVTKKQLKVMRIQTFYFQVCFFLQSFCSLFLFITSKKFLFYVVIPNDYLKTKSMVTFCVTYFMFVFVLYILL